MPPNCVTLRIVLRPASACPCDAAGAAAWCILYCYPSLPERWPQRVGVYRERCLSASWEDGIPNMPKPVRQKSVNYKRATRPNKAQVRAPQIRAEQMAAKPDELLAEDVDPDANKIETMTSQSIAPLAPVAPALPPVRKVTMASARSESVSTSRRSSSRRPVRDAVPRIKTLTRQQEYTFVRADLRRLLYTAGGVLVVMIALLFVIEQ